MPRVRLCIALWIASLIAPLGCGSSDDEDPLFGGPGEVTGGSGGSGGTAGSDTAGSATGGAATGGGATGGGATGGAATGGAGNPYCNGQCSDCAAKADQTCFGKVGDLCCYCSSITPVGALGPPQCDNSSNTCTCYVFLTQ